MIPNAPTDNLYKFITVLGIVLFVFCAWTLNDLILQIDRQVSNAETTNRTVERKSASIDATIEDLKTSQAAINERLSRRNETPLNRDEITELLSRVERLLQQIVQTETASIELAQENDSVLPIVTEARVLLRHYNAHAWALYLGAVFGLAMSATGVVLWYLLHQRYQDTLLRTQLATELVRSSQPQTKEKT